LNSKTVIPQMLVFAGALAASSCVAQVTNAQTYALLSGSQLVDDCPICDRPTIVVPLKGTFTLSLLDQNTLFTRYALTDISFQAGAQPGREYTVAGSGIYQIGGEVAVLQHLFLDVAINNGFTNTGALCVSTFGAVSQKWPQIETSVDQTNGTPGQVYHLTLNAVPMPKVYSFPPDPQTGTVRLLWEANGGSFQVERATSIEGPFATVTTATTNSAFSDVGILTNHSLVFYRVRRL
jgi:hypothetical protein